MEEPIVGIPSEHAYTSIEKYTNIWKYITLANLL